MSADTIEKTGVVRAAYAQAWEEFNRFSGLTPDEKLGGPAKLRSYIRTLTDTGERNPEKIAKSALGLIRESEQKERSKVRVATTENLFRVLKEPDADMVGRYSRESRAGNRRAFLAPSLPRRRAPARSLTSCLPGRRQRHSTWFWSWFLSLF
jgi:hypothetical protein